MQYEVLKEREEQYLKKQEELKSLKEAIYEKVMSKKQDLEKINEELIRKEDLLREQGLILEKKKIDVD